MKTLQFGIEDFLENLEKFTLKQDDIIYSQEWFSGTTALQWKPYYKRDIKKARFALKNRGICYLAKDHGRIDVEIGEYFRKDKDNNSSINFAQQLWPRMIGQAVSSESEQEIKGAFRIDRIAKIFDLNNYSNSEIVFQRNEQAYIKSGNFAEELFNKNFDGILYKPCTLIKGIIGPCTDSMLVLFEPKNEKRKLFTYYHINKEIG